MGHLDEKTVHLTNETPIAAGATGYEPYNDVEHAQRRRSSVLASIKDNYGMAAVQAEDGSSIKQGIDFTHRSLKVG